MPSWVYWALFLLLAACAPVLARKLDERDRERRLGRRTRKDSHGPT